MGRWTRVLQAIMPIIERTFLLGMLPKNEEEKAKEPSFRWHNKWGVVSARGTEQPGIRHSNSSSSLVVSGCLLNLHIPEWSPLTPARKTGASALSDSSIYQHLNLYAYICIDTFRSHVDLWAHHVLSIWSRVGPLIGGSECSFNLQIFFRSFTLCGRFSSLLFPSKLNEGIENSDWKMSASWNLKIYRFSEYQNR